jgi:putative copper export protein/mono/diheme cytochrome c family protein
MIPADIVTAVLRGAHVAALTSLFGTLVFGAVVVGNLPETPWARLVYLRLARLGWGSLLFALVLGVAWFVAEAAAIADTSSMRETLAVLPDVGLKTQFGRLVLARFVLLFALLPVGLALRERALRDAGRVGNGPDAPAGDATAAPLRAALTGAAIHREPRGPPQPKALRNRSALVTAIILAAGALGLQAAVGHAGAMEGVAGNRLLIAEALHVWAAGAWLGGLVPLLVCLVTMPPEAAALAARRFFPLGLATVSVIAATSLIQATYLVGSVPALVGTAYGRVALLKLLLFLSLLVLAALNRFVFSARPGAPLRRSIICETGFAIAVVLTAGFLAHLTPGAHEQPVWPLQWRMNPKTPGGLFVAAYPTSFFVSSTGFTAAAIVHGEQLYQADCASCHGVSGQGDGPAAPNLPSRPPDLTTRGLLEYSDGDLFWLAGHAVVTADEDRWDLIDYLRAHNRGEFVRTSGRAVVPLRIPQFNAVCADGREMDSDDLRGQVVRIVVPDADTQGQHLVEPEPATRLVTITLPANAAAPRDAAGCMAQQEGREAFAILLGITSDALAGSQFLVDPNGWLRARWHPGEAGGWSTPERLSARVRALAEHPLPADPTSGHAHHH